MEMIAPPFLPLFRSPGQARLLAELFLRAPATGLGLTELARRSKLAIGTAHREVNRLEGAGIVHSERVGKERRVRASETSPFHAELRGLLLKAFGPALALAQELAEVPGVQEAFIFGSWARRYEGEPGEPPADLDLLVVGDPAPDLVYAACRRAEARLGLAVNPTVLSQDEWESRQSGFLRRVREGPRVPVVGG
jgi:DNA-binding MarR family transcriptional regulator